MTESPNHGLGRIVALSVLMHLIAGYFLLKLPLMPMPVAEIIQTVNLVPAIRRNVITAPVPERRPVSVPDRPAKAMPPEIENQDVPSGEASEAGQAEDITSSHDSSSLPPVIPMTPDARTASPLEGGGLAMPVPVAPRPSLSRSQLLDRGIIDEAARTDKQSRGDKKSPITFSTNDYKYAGYMGRLKERIENIWVYPPQAIENQQYGDLFITFVIRRDGSLGSVELVRTSGYRSLDEAALEALKNSAPFWPIPESWEEESMTIPGHFIYSLSSSRPTLR